MSASKARRIPQHSLRGLLGTAHRHPQRSLHCRDPVSVCDQPPRPRTFVAELKCTLGGFNLLSHSLHGAIRWSVAFFRQVLHQLRNPCFSVSLGVRFYLQSIAVTEYNDAAVCVYVCVCVCVCVRVTQANLTTEEC